MHKVEIESDGATIPCWKRWSWSRRFGADVMSRLDEAGYYHDYLIESGLDKEKARKLMMIKMIELKIPQDIIEYVTYWLGRYDAMPSIFKRVLNKIARSKSKKVEVEI